MTDFVIVYTLSDVGSMVKDCIKSVRDLRRFTDAPVHIVITPPCPEPGILEKLKKHNVETKTNRCDLLFTYNKTEPFKIRPHTRTGRFGEKIGSLSMFDCENILFLDNDTRIIKTPEKLFESDFDFSARIDNGFSLVNWDSWTQIFNSYNLEPMPLFNAGVLVFKNGCCSKIMKDALRYVAQDLPSYGEYYQKDQLAISLSVSQKYKIKYMDESDHAFRWLDESHNTIIYHGTRRPLIKRVGLCFKNLINHFR